MSWQTTLEQARSIRLGRNTIIGLVAGIVLGLLLGLLIGWVWWPVEWQGAETAATTAQAGSQFETPEAKALYLGAVADAFVLASAAGEADAASVAAQRLAALGGDMRAAFGNAIDFYNGQAGGAQRVNNLTTLAMAVGIPLGDIASAAGAPQPAAQDAPATASSGGAATSSATSAADGGAAQDGGSANWLLTLLFALLLIGGGLYILWTLQRRQSLGQDEESGFDAEDVSPAPVTTPAFDRSALTPMRAGLTPAASIRSSVERPQTSQAGGPHAFDAEEIDEYYDSEDDGGAEPYDEFDVPPHYRAAGAAAQTDETADEEEDDWGDQKREVQSGPHTGPPAGFVTSVGATPPFSSSRSAPGDLRQPPAADEPGATPAAPVAARQPPPATLQPPTPSRFERYTPIESYTATYFAGRVDFDFTKNVSNPNGSNYIGEYGMGIHEKRGYLNNDLEKAIAIDIYLFDKTDERQPVSVSRSLLSLYAHDHRLAEFERERENQTLPAIVARPNTHFQLEGRQLLLDCLIKQVDYTPEGVFQNVTMELVLKRKN
jgi:hypothetical protein